MKRLYFFSIFVGIIFILVGLVFWHSLYNQELLSPVNDLSKFSFLRILNTGKNKNHLVYGFLPYWNLDKATIQPELTQLAYFGLGIQADGTVKFTEDGYTEPGYAKLSSVELAELLKQAKQKNIQAEIVLKQFDPDQISQFLLNDQAQEELFQTLDSLLLAYDFKGVNVDIEYSGTVTDGLKQKYSEFIQKLNQHLEKQHPEVTLSADLYASAASKDLIWDVPTISKELDYLIVMAYDYHQRNSTISGPVAPLFGATKPSESDITKHLKEFLKTVPAEKLVLGVPFYGYEWQTSSRSLGEKTFPNTGSTASFKRVEEILAQKQELQVEEHWDENTLSPFLSYEEDGAIYMIYYENSRSLSYKLDLVKQLDLAGIAIWALGYEGKSRELWEVINNKL